MHTTCIAMATRNSHLGVIPQVVAYVNKLNMTHAPAAITTHYLLYKAAHTTPHLTNIDSLAAQHNQPHADTIVQSSFIIPHITRQMHSIEGVSLSKARVCQIFAGLGGIPFYWWAQDRRGVFSNSHSCAWPPEKK